MNAFQRRGNLGMSTAQFDTGVIEFVQKLRAFIRARVPDDATADDLTQETLFKVYRSRASLREDDRLEAWLYRIARRTLIDYYRKRRPSEELPASLKSDSQAEVDTIRGAVLISTIRYMEELPDTYRIPLQLSELEGMTMAQIAARLGLSLTAVKSRIRRGRQILKKMLQECCHFEFDQHGKVIGWERRNPRCCD
jgi:RNA polymerase sigma-70 factor (ECF subfamily)